MSMGFTGNRRSAVADDVIGGHHIPRGSMVLIGPYMTHRLPDLWDYPERFDPERFLPGGSTPRLGFTHLPFGDGPRTCMGNHLAMLEMHLVLATLAQRYRLELPPGELVEPWAVGTLRQRDTLWMTPRERCSPGRLMRVLVTGEFGDVGTRVPAELSRAGHTVGAVILRLGAVAVAVAVTLGATVPVQWYRLAGLGIPAPDDRLCTSDVVGLSQPGAGPRRRRHGVRVSPRTQAKLRRPVRNSASAP
jgi:hypothetical protein